LDVAILRWRKYQLAKWKRTAALKDPYFIELMVSGKKSWSGIRKYLREQEGAYETVRGKLVNVLSKLTDAATELCPRSEGERRGEGGGRARGAGDQRHHEGCLGARDPLAPSHRWRSECREDVRASVLARILREGLKCEAAIDSHIDKLLGRLVSLKEYKRVYGAHTLLLPKIKSPPTAPDLGGPPAGR